MGRPGFDTSSNMKTVVLITRLTTDLWNTFKAAIMDSGLCVLKVILETRKRGVYGSTLIKNIILAWGGHVDGINDYFS